MKAPCKNCTRKGCGAYHDKCPEYMEFRKNQAEISNKRIEKLDMFFLKTEKRWKIWRV